MSGGIRLDFERRRRLGFGEAVLCAGKTAAQIDAILEAFDDQGEPCLLTRLEAATLATLSGDHRRRIDHDGVSRTGFYRFSPPEAPAPQVAVVSAGASDAPAAGEAVRTLTFNAVGSTAVPDVGVAGLWRLMERIEEIGRHPVVIAVAGMDAALASVLGGLVPGALIAVPTSTGYGAARGGETALAACLASCAPGVVVCNIDNGYGAACAAIRTLSAVAGRQGAPAGQRTGSEL